MRTARRSLGKTPYPCRFDWPEDCSVQCGDNGIVVSLGTMESVLSGDMGAAKDVLLGKRTVYETAFFEAFPKDPKTFIRGEGASIEEAEEKYVGKIPKI